MNATLIDTNNTWAYARYYSSFASPWISRLISKLAVWFEFNLVQPDDYKILISSQPHSSGLKVNNYVRADKAIVIWHKMYERQINC
ncbi:MAG: hypothetical protein KI793_07945 [Rivularia sp. (in: Bacteria)]|nr:hypothetical protein [Rivularia sp. MS3]